MKFTQLPKRTLIVGISIIVVFVVAGIVTGVMVVMVNNTTENSSDASVKQRSATAVEKDAYNKVDEGKYEEAISLFKQALELSEAEGRPQSDIENIKTQISFAEQELARIANEKDTSETNTSHYTVEQGENGIKLIVPTGR